MAGKAGDDAHIRPERGTDVLDRTEPDIRETDVREPDAEAAGQPTTAEAVGKPAAADGPVEADRSAFAGGAPVFVDPSGRRAGRMRRVGWLVAAGCVCSAATLGLVVTDRDSTAPWLSIPGVLGADNRNRGAEVAQEPEPTRSGTPAADSPAAAAARPPARQETDGATTGAEVMTGSRSKESGTGTSPAGKSTATPSAAADGTAGSGTADGTETPAGLPTRSPDTGTGTGPATQPGSEAPVPDAPAESPSTGLGGLVDAVSGLFGR